MKGRFSLAFAAISLGLQASAQLVDFEDIANNGKGGFTTYGDSVDSRGYRFESIYYGGKPDAIASWTADDPFGYDTGSTAIFANYFDDSLIMTKLDGGMFEVSSIDIADVYLGSSNATIAFVGIRFDGSKTIEYVTLSDGSSLESYPLLTMTFLISMEIFEDNDSSLQIDNVVVVPEPAAWFGLVLGLVGAGLRRRSADKKSEGYRTQRVLMFTNSRMPSADSSRP